MKLYTYFRSSASYRVRIALNVKGLSAEMIPVNLLKAENTNSSYTQINPQGLLPTLVTDAGEALSQSLAIMEYLDEIKPEPALLPRESIARARVRALSLMIACEIAPLNNVGVLRYLTGELVLSEEQKTGWMHHWMGKGFAALEASLQKTAGAFCFGDAPGMADCCLVPQVFNARRFDLVMTPYPTIEKIAANCDALPAFQKAHPKMQQDFL